VFNSVSVDLVLTVSALVSQNLLYSDAAAAYACASHHVTDGKTCVNVTLVFG